MQPIKGGKASSLAKAVFESLKAAVGTEYAHRHETGMGIDPSAYVTAHSFSLDYAVCKYLSKYEGACLPGLREKAVTAFKDAEERNRLANLRIVSGALSGPAVFCLEEARREIQRCLGSFRVQEFLDCCEWGPGATATIMAEDATVDNKILESQLSVSRLALPWARLYLLDSLAWLSARLGVEVSGPCCLLSSEFFIVDEGRFTTVPKDYKSERGIDVQPTLNIFLQKGVGLMIRRRLQRMGINLDDQSRNQMLASLAQRLGLATIDLAQASDSLCFELVRYLLPDDWFRVLRDLRTPGVNMGDSCVRLEKFSAMGNGYTFELESLIFWALCSALQRRFSLTDTLLGVYGDDLIVDSRLSGALIALFKEVGFTVNVDKTFTEGRFYESCGKHYFDGFDVTPPYQKEEIVDVPSACRAANRLFRWALRLGGGYAYDTVASEPWRVAAEGAIRFHDAYNARRWVKWVEGGAQPRHEPEPTPFPFIPHWLPDDFGLLYPRHFHLRNGVIVFNRLIFIPRSREGEQWAVTSNYLRQQASRRYGDSTLLESGSNKATRGFVNPRGNPSVSIGVGKTTPVTSHCDWPNDWPTNPV